LRDQTLQALEIILDERFRIPGTPVRFGVDGILGMIPVVGDVLGGLLSLVIPLAAWTRGIPYVTLIRMLANLGVGVVIGSIPLLGDIVDIFWKANRRNYRLLQLHEREPRAHTASDWVFLGILALAIVAVFALPVILFLWLLAWMIHGFAPR
jgi:hypothetical protein